MEIPDVLPPGHHRLAARWWFWHQKKTKRATTSWSDGIICTGKFNSVEGFWAIHSHMHRPDGVQGSADYMLFKEGIKPMWEDEANTRGGRVTLKVKKGITSRLWEEILLALIGEQFDVSPTEICGVVLSMRYSDDSISIWNRNADNEVAIAKIRDHVARLIHAPAWLDISYVRHGGKGKHGAATGGREGEVDADASPTMAAATSSTMPPPISTAAPLPRASPSLPSEDASLVRLPLSSSAKGGSNPVTVVVAGPASTPTAPAPVAASVKTVWGKTMSPVAAAPAPTPTAASTWAAAATVASPAATSAPTSGSSGRAHPPAGSTGAVKRPANAAKGKSKTPSAGAPSASEGTPDDGWQTVASRR